MGELQPCAWCGSVRYTRDCKSRTYHRESIRRPRVNPATVLSGGINARAFQAMGEPTEADRREAARILIPYRTRLINHEPDESLEEAIARALRDARARSTGWVPTSERMPTGEARALMIADAKGSVTSRPCAVLFWWDPKYRFGGNVTHWQEVPPLPEPPQDGETGGGR